MFILIAVKTKTNAGGQDLFEHECPTCHRRYHTKQILKQHIMIHGEKTYLCSVCGKGFYNNAGLQTHIKVVIKFVYFNVFI